MFYMLRTTSVIVIITGIALFLLTGCKDSNPTGSDGNSPNVPDTVSYENVYGEWAGGVPYTVPDRDAYESDTFYVTHFGIYKKKAAVGDSIGYIRWDNRNEYCKGTLLAVDQSPGDSVIYRKTNVSSQDGEHCASRNQIESVEYVKKGTKEWLIYGEEWAALDAGKLYPKE